jgi:iron complex outermembrane receptor protein
LILKGMRTIFTPLAWVACTAAWAQSAAPGAVRGRITDSRQEPQVGLVVRLENTAFGTTTDADGTFFLEKVPAGQYTLVVSGLGYSAQKQALVVPPGQTARLSLALDPQRQALEEVVVREGRPFEADATGATRTRTPIKDLPQSVQVINQATLQQQQVYRVDEALKNAAGVTESSAWGSYNFRGFDTNSQSFLTNGIKGTGNPEGVMPFLANVERVEVLRGSAALLYGEGAVGGTLNLVTKQPKKATTANARVGVGSFGLVRAQADVAGSLTADKRLYGIVGVGFENGGTFVNDNRHRTTQYFGSLRWEPGLNTSWQLNATYNRDRSTRSLAQELPQYADRLFAVSDNFNISGAEAYYRGDSYQLQSQFQQRFSANWAANLWLGYAEGHTDEIRYATRGFITDDAIARRQTRQRVHSPTRTANLFVTGRLGLGPTQHQLVTGLDLTYQNSNYPSGIQIRVAPNLSVRTPDYAALNEATARVTYDSDNERFTTNTSGVYVQDQVALGQKLKALVGVRLNHYHTTYIVDNVSYSGGAYEPYEERPDNTTAVLPRVGLVYQPSAAHSFYADYNTGFVPQYSNSPAYGGPFDPERTHQVELGWKGDLLDHRLVPTVAVYQIQKANVLNLDPDQLALGNYIYRTIGGVRSRGAEATLTGTVVPGWQVILNYSLNRTIVNESNVPEEINQDFPNAPRHLASSWTTYELQGGPLKGLQFGGGYRYTSARYSAPRNQDDDTVLRFPGYGVLDAVLAYRTHGFTLQANGNNLLGKQYVRSGLTTSYFPGTPRSFFFSLGYSL